jgi:hypothetical protein
MLSMSPVLLEEVGAALREFVGDFARVNPTIEGSL